MSTWQARAGEPASGFRVRILAALLAAAALVSSSEASTPMEACESQLARTPDSSEAAECFKRAATSDRLEEEAVRRLAALLPRYPQNHWLKRYLADLQWNTSSGRAEELYAAAARGFADQANALGEVRTRYALRSLLFQRGKLEEAKREVERTLEVARRSGQPELIGQALMLQAAHLSQTGDDVGRAYRLLREAEPMLSSSDDYNVRRSLLFELASASFYLGRYDVAEAYYRRFDSLVRQAGDTRRYATATLNIANALLAQLSELPRSDAREEVISLTETGLELAAASGNPRLPVQAHWTLGEVLENSDPSRARWHLERCVAGARKIQDNAATASCLWLLGGLLWDRDPREAHRCVAQAATLAVASGNPLMVAIASRQRMRTAWKTGPRDKAIETSLEALDTIEALRDLQHDTSGSAGVFSTWVMDYDFTLGSLLDGRDGAPPRPDLELAFTIGERLRARILLEKLAAARTTPARPPADPRQKRRREVLEAIVDVHRRLLHPDLTGERRRDALAELGKLELEEAALRAATGGAAGPTGGSRTTAFATLEEVEEGLAADEALLSFHVALWEDVYGNFGGGSWLIASTRQGSRAFRLPDEVRLQPVVPVFLGLFERRDGSEAAPGAVLYRQLLQEALGWLPPGVRKLTIVPDGALHRLPFGALRASVESEPLAARYQLGVVPSATLWLRWRRGRVAPELAALAMADPEPLRADSSAKPAEERAWLVAEGVRLGRLPFARREGRAVLRHLGGGSRLLVGREASEQYLKEAHLGKTGILHLAAHAVLDEENPERAAILLAPGSEREDGFLQVREIADLRLDGQLVVLSACQTASGSVLRGEGVMGLARAFFQAGARTVIGSLWPLRDDEAAALFDAFYRHLASGESVAEAMREAQADAIRAGRPASAWAGVVVLGDASLTFPTKKPTPRGWLQVALPGAILVLAGAFVALRYRRHTAPRGEQS